MRLFAILTLMPVILFAAGMKAVPRSGVVTYPPDSQRVHAAPLDDAGQSVRMNQDPFGSDQNEITIAAWILNPQIVLSGSNDYRNGDASAGFYASIDGGNTFFDAIIARGPQGEFQAAGDPVAAIDRNGRMVVTYIAFDRDSPDNGIYSQSSLDSGNTWSAPTAIAEHIGGNEFDFEDKPYTCFDLSPTSPYVNRHYVTWTKFEEMGTSPIFSAYSDDGGASYSEPVLVSSSILCQFSTPTTGPNGEVYAVWIDYWNESIAFNASFDGGSTWDHESVIGPFTELMGQPNPCGGFRTPSYPMIGCDISNGPRRGYLYACWAGYNGNNPDILLSTSSDSGATWSAPRRVDDGPMGSWQWWQWMVVHPQTGDLGIAWLDRRDDEDGCLYRPYATVSTDGGQSFLPSFPLTDVLSDPSSAFFLGDYCGATFRDHGGFYYGWVDLRNDGGDAYATWFRAGIPAPQGLTIIADGPHARLDWFSVEDASYRVYSAYDFDGPYFTFEGATSDTFLVDSNAFIVDREKYYHVVARTQ